jgi:hypothetical protein
MKKLVTAFAAVGLIAVIVTPAFAEKPTSPGAGGQLLSEVIADFREDGAVYGKELGDVISSCSDHGTDINCNLGQNISDLNDN